jgi:hypothetical protein
MKQTKRQICLTELSIQITALLDVKPCIWVDTNVPEYRVALVFRLEANQKTVAIH